MKTKNKIAEAVVRRMPKYLRCLEEIEKQGILKVSSLDLSKQLNITASQVRQDFSNFGGFGQQGYGYEIAYLKEQIKSILCIDRQYNMVIVGAGHIGQALANFKGFNTSGFKVLAIFDVKEEKFNVPESVKVLKSDELVQFLNENEVDIVAITTSASSADAITEEVKKTKVKGIWNFTPHTIIDDDLIIENLNMNESLYTLTYKLNNRAK